MLRAAYEERVKTGDLRADAAQASIIGHLTALSTALETRGSQGFLGQLINPQKPPRSLYIHGEVGRGKTMLMDLFFDHVQINTKQRVHFHAFMQDIHKRRKTLKTGDPLALIAKDIAGGTRLLCLDEMQISDIADAMIIGRLFEALLDNGTVIVTTSNLPPNLLYKDGLNRQLFLPSIALINTRFDVLSLASPTDYRLGRVKAWESFVTPLGAKADAHVQQVWERLAETPKGEPLDIAVLGRQLHVPESAHGCARFSFAELCEAPLGPADYLALAENFQTVFVENIPALKISQRNEAKRFVLLIDTLYDRRVRLVASSARSPEEIYPQGHHRLEFGRTISRLQEMQSASWWGQKIVET